MGLITFLKRRDDPVSRKLCSRIGDQRVLEGEAVSRKFQPDCSYFQIRLSEMFLNDRTQYGINYVPFTLAVSDFIYDEKRQEIPFFVGQQMLQSIEPYIKGNYVEFRNTRIAGPIPYVGDDVSLFVGLFRTEVSNLAKSLFGFLQRIVGLFDVSVLSSYLDISGQIGEGLSDLLGLSEVQMRFGNRIAFSESETDPLCFKEGYIAYINCSENSLDTDRLWVKEGSLHSGRTESDIRPFREHDYCLIKIEYGEKRGDLHLLPFHKLWKDVKKLIWQGYWIEARRLFLVLMQQLALSPDLTTGHRNILVQVYEANYESELEGYEKLNRKQKRFSEGAAGRAGKKKRGARKKEKRLSAHATIQRAAEIAYTANLPQAAQEGLDELSIHWNAIPFLQDRTKEFQLSDDILNEQFEKMTAISKIENPDPRALVDAITVATLGAS